MLCDLLLTAVFLHVLVAVVLCKLQFGMDLLSKLCLAAVLLSVLLCMLLAIASHVCRTDVWQTGSCTSCMPACGSQTLSACLASKLRCNVVLCFGVFSMSPRSIAEYSICQVAAVSKCLPCAELQILL